MNYHTEFPDFGELDVTLPPGLEDQSWNQDTCPCFGIVVRETERTGVLGLTLFIDYADSGRSESPGEDRFRATSGDPTDGNNTDWFITNDWDEMRAWIEAHRPTPEQLLS